MTSRTFASPVAYATVRSNARCSTNAVSRNRVRRRSMDGRGRWIDNVFVERLWKSVKYEHVYLHAYESVAEARQQLTSDFTFYNAHRPHSSLGGTTPDTAYFGKLETRRAA